MGAARQYGVVEQTPEGRLQLTNLGFAIVSKDDATERAARADAFLNASLFRKTYEEFRDRPLPPRPLGLESASVQFGVAPKVKAYARLIFEKSARQAGFLNVDPNRLIQPIIGGTADRLGSDADSEALTSQAHSSASSPTGSFELDELVRGLLRRLPKPGEKWNAERKAKWLSALS